MTTLDRPATPTARTLGDAANLTVSPRPAPSWQVRASILGGWFARPIEHDDRLATVDACECRWFESDEWELAVRWADLHARRAS